MYIEIGTTRAGAYTGRINLNRNIEGNQFKFHLLGTFGDAPP